MITKMRRFRNDDGILDQGGRKEKKRKKDKKRGKIEKMKPHTRWPGSIRLDI